MVPDKIRTCASMMAQSRTKGQEALDVAPTQQPLSRSPHPYTFSSSTLATLKNADGAYDTDPSSSHTNDGQPLTSSPPWYFDADHRTRRRALDDSSESATEADDEKEPLLLRLPAPNLRPRKGLKGDIGSVSPLLTPSYLDDEGRTATLERKARRRASFQSQDTEAEALKLREKFKRRRRAEVIRRATETVLFLFVSHIGTRGCFCRSAKSLWREYDVRKLLHAQRELPPLFDLPAFGLTILALYLLYPCRIIFKNHNLSVRKEKPWYYIHLPAAFDPAPLLYPVLLPASVACLVGGRASKTFLLNLTLGLSSIPTKIIPFGALGWCNSPAWILSVIPILIFREQLKQTTVTSPTASHQELEFLTLIHSFHQVTLPVLRSLTTTSLLPAELQLLSTALVNLFVLSETPQSLILKAVLWVGSVALLVLCSKLLRVGVAIARIPTWRLKRPRIPRKSSWTIVQALYDLRNSSARNGKSNEDTDEDDATFRRRMHGINQRLGRTQTLSVDVGHPVPALQRAPTVSVVGDYLNAKSTTAELDGHLKDHPLSRRGRSNTLPVNTEATENAMSITKPGLTVKHASRMLQKASLRNMTPPQAALLRWLMAGYFYVTVIVLIFLPIKSYVERRALVGSEPIAWALDYLFGDLHSFQDHVDDWGVRPWIPYQNHQQLLLDLKTTGRAEKFRLHTGLANTRLLVCAYAIAVIAGGLAVVFRLSPVADVDTRRKVFHGMMVMMFLPTTFIDPSFVGLAFALVLVIFLLLDLIRASQLPPLARPLTNFLAPYVDGRDHRGPVIVSHIFLLIGCAIPLWLSLASVPRLSTRIWRGWELPTRNISMVSGIICVGMGDAAASLFGRRYGRRRWCWSGGKSLEGSLAFAIAVVLGLTLARAWMLVGGWPGDSGDSLAVFWTKCVIAGCGASLTEAVLTGGNDNVIVPVILWILVKGLGI